MIFVERMVKAQSFAKDCEASLTEIKHDLNEIVDSLLDREEQCAQVKE